MAVLAGRVPPELEYVFIALAPAGLGMGGGGVWDPLTVRDWPEQVAADVAMVIGTLNRDRAARQSRK